MNMLEMQVELQKEAYGIDLMNCSQEDRMKYIRENTLALIDELMETLAETGWKPWATSNHLNEAAYKSELVDAWHFFMNLMALGGMTLDELQAGYEKKRQKNLQRQLDGYDGVSTKCPTCHRAFDDDAVECSPGLCAYNGQAGTW